jgi:prepilin-type N-terminal cleavage/methylation domain-containing protein/prepilin-type processing-associated H-X9-DG protein
MNRREKQTRRGRPASGAAEKFSTPIIHHRLSFINPAGFTLIELLVVISIITLLMALMLPVLSRVRKQARAVACQANLKQWGVRVEAGASEDDASHRKWDNSGNIHEAWSFQGDVPPSGNRSRDMRFCPVAGRLANEVTGGDQDPQGGTATGHGGTFRAWGPIFPPEVPSPHGSYGTNGALSASNIGQTTGKTGRRVDVRGQGRIPVMLDSTWIWTQPKGTDDDDAPPESDAIPVANGKKGNWQSCINRHDGGVNCLFFDWSVRKVGLKELWTLKWHPQYDTAGRWTKAGGVKPEDWPQWMRGFKDY